MEPTSTDSAGSREWLKAAENMQIVIGNDVEGGPVPTEQVRVHEQCGRSTQRSAAETQPEPPFGTHIREAVNTLRGA